VACFGSSVAALADEPPILSPADLWRGYDPTALPLDVEILSAWDEEACHYEKLRFTAEVIDGTPIRVFTLRGSPLEGDRLPGILHIHGGGQTASQEWVRFWARRGYACVSFDFCGPLPGRTEFTDWKPLTHGNMADAAGGLQVAPTPRNSSWYHWTLASRRALTLLADTPRVDSGRLGIFGISVGGTLCWMVAGADDRVRTAAPIYGCGYNYDRRKAVWGWGDLSPELSLWQQAVSSEAHAPYIRCPIMLLNATNDFHGWMDNGPEILGAVPTTTRVAYSPNWNHHITAREGVNLPAWMDWQLRDGPAFPAAPTVEVALDADGVPSAVVDADATEPIERIEVYYALGDQAPPNRFWRRVEARFDGHTWRAALPVMHVWQRAWTFANVYYMRPLCLSSNLLPFVPGQLGPARSTLDHSALLTVPLAWRYGSAHTDPSIERTYVLPPRDAEDAGALRLNAELFGPRVTLRASSNYLADPQFAGRPGTWLVFDYQGRFDAGLKTSVVSRNWTPLTKTWHVQLPADEFTGESGTIRIAPERFQTDAGERLSTWDNLDTLQFEGEAAGDPAPVLRRFRWEAP
jgi:dienelactone hydrolase